MNQPIKFVTEDALSVGRHSCPLLPRKSLGIAQLHNALRSFVRNVHEAALAQLGVLAADSMRDGAGRPIFSVFVNPDVLKPLDAMNAEALGLREALEAFREVFLRYVDVDVPSVMQMDAELQAAFAGLIRQGSDDEPVEEAFGDDDKPTDEFLRKRYGRSYNSGVLDLANQVTGGLAKARDLWAQVMTQGTAD